MFGGTTGLGAAVDGIDAVVKAVSDVADAALPKAGGTMTGALNMKGSTEVATDQGNMTGTSTPDLDNGDYFYGTLTGDCTIDFTNYPASGKVEFWFLEITNGGAHTITWSGVDQWIGGSAPTLQSSGTDLLMFWTRDAGTTVYGALCAENLS